MVSYALENRTLNMNKPSFFSSLNIYFSSEIEYMMKSISHQFTRVS